MLAPRKAAPPLLAQCNHKAIPGGGDEPICVGFVVKLFTGDITFENMSESLLTSQKPITER